MNRRYLLLAVVALAAGVAAWLGFGSRIAAMAARKRFEQEMQALASTRLRTDSMLGASTTPALVHQLRLEYARGMEPFNSPVTRELVRRDTGVAPGVAPVLRDSLVTKDATSLLILLALKDVSDSTYETLGASYRADVLTDALGRSQLFNTWGLPHILWEKASLALIALGDSARPQLTALLGERRRAQTWGSAFAMENDRYAYRVRDYAWAILRTGAGFHDTIPVSPVQRDSLILAQYHVP